MTHWHLGFLACAVAALSACEIPTTGGTNPNSIQTIGFAPDAPAGAAPGTCWGKTIAPAIIETVSREVLIEPAQVSPDGRIQQPAVYKKEDQLNIIRPRAENWFETVCPTLLTEEFVASLQRALSVRGTFRGQATGLMDDRTRKAIRKFQEGDGFDSGNLTVKAARELGLVSVPRSPE